MSHITETETTSFKEYEASLPVVKYIDSMGIKFPIIVLAQSIQETTDKGCIFNSTICKENKNFFGMKYNKRGHAQGTKRGHAFYNSKIDSFLDYRDWQKQMLSRVKYRVETEEEYYYFLEHLPTNQSSTGRYAEDPNYVDHLRSHVKTLRQLRSTQQ